MLSSRFEFYFWHLILLVASYALLFSFAHKCAGFTSQAIAGHTQEFVRQLGIGGRSPTLAPIISNPIESWPGWIQLVEDVLSLVLEALKFVSWCPPSSWCSPVMLSSSSSSSSLTVSNSSAINDPFAFLLSLPWPSLSRSSSFTLTFPASIRIVCLKLTALLLPMVRPTLGSQILEQASRKTESSNHHAADAPAVRACALGSS